MNGWRLLSDDSAGGDADELIQQWTRDPADVRDRRLILMRTAHLLMAPGIVALLALFLRHRPVLIAAWSSVTCRCGDMCCDLVPGSPSPVAGGNCSISFRRRYTATRWVAWPRASAQPPGIRAPVDTTPGAQ